MDLNYAWLNDAQGGTVVRAWSTGTDGELEIQTPSGYSLRVQLKDYQLFREDVPVSEAA